MFQKVLSFLVVSVLTFFCGAVPAQNEKKDLLGMSFGGSNFHILDRLAAELIFRGTGIAPSIVYNHTSGRNSHTVEGVFYYNNLFSTSDIYKTILFAGQFRYAFLRTVLSGRLFNNQFDLRPGASISSIFSHYEYNFDMQTIWANAIKSWYGCHSADFAMQVGYALGERNGFEMTCFVPLVSNISRPAYSSSGDYDYEKNDRVIKPFGNTEFMTENSVFNSHIGYTYNAKGGLSLKTEYEFYFARCKKPGLIKLYMNNVRAGIMYNFKNKDRQ
jgi:hypothetical protein